MEATAHADGRGLAARFTVDGSNELEEFLAGLCDRVVVGVRNIFGDGRLEAVLLGGGYGRGEGGVLNTAQGDRPYNDLEFYVCVRGSTLLNEKRFRPALDELGHRLSVDAGIEVEFKITSQSRIERSSTTMFFYDLVVGHRKVWGDARVLDRCAHHRDARRIPLAEATRLLMNRTAGLLFSKEHLSRTPFTEENADFVGRNHAKAQLAFGDVVLTVFGEYHSNCRERHRRLLALKPEETLPWLSQVQSLHATGVQFKLHPEKRSGRADDFAVMQLELTNLGRQIWLWLENRRLNQKFPSVTDYVLSTVDKAPETNGLKNRLINARTFGAATLLKSGATRYPRERLFNALGLLLWESRTLQDGRLLAFVQDELQTRAKTFPELVAAFQRLWQRFN